MNNILKHVEEKTFIIAEIGSNHNQSLELAIETIDAAKEAGADAVKFQSINIDKLYYKPSQETIELHKKIDLPEDWHYKLKEYCDKKDIVFFSSPTYLEAIDILEEIEVPLYKLASAQIGTFPQLVEKVASLGKPVILSTGLVSYSGLEKIIQLFHQQNNHNYIILHCNSIYPTPYDRVHLPMMNLYKEMFGSPVGFSDHTLGIYAPVVAVSQGAKVIEKHFTLSRDLPVPDASFSLEPEELKQMVEGIRAAEQMLQPSYRLEIEQEEKAFKNAIKTRLVLIRDKKKGEKLNYNDVIFKRASAGIDCAELDDLLDKRSSFVKNATSGSLLEANFLSE